MTAVAYGAVMALATFAGVGTFEIVENLGGSAGEVTIASMFAVLLVVFLGFSIVEEVIS